MNSNSNVIHCYGLPHVTVFRTRDWLHLQCILYKGFYTLNAIYAPFGAVSVNIRRIFHVTTHPPYNPFLYPVCGVRLLTVNVKVQGP